MSDWSILSRKLGASRGAITKTCLKIKEISGLDPLKIDELDVLKATLISQRDRLDTLNDKFDEFCDTLEEKEIDEQLQKMEDYRIEVDSHISLCTVLRQSNESSKNLDDKTAVKLPSLTLPNFDGDVLKWNDFFESFSVGVDKRKISSVEKFQYLKSCLKGDAQTILDGLPLSDANYSAALRLLQDRFGSKRRLLLEHIRALINFSPPKYQNHSSMRIFVDQVNKHTRGLESLDMVQDNYGILFGEILLAKMPKEIKHEFVRLDEETAGLKELLTIIEREAKMQELLIQTTDTSLTNGTSPRHTPYKGSRSFQAQSTVANCYLCGSKDHFIYKCTKFLQMEPKERHSIAKEKRLCFNCLGKHLSKDCQSKSGCKVCHRKHNTMLHFSSDEDKFSIEKVSVNYSSCNDKQFSVLPVLSVPIKTENGTKSIGALLDSGSDRSFLSSKVLQHICYTHIESQNLSIQSFGSNNTRDQGELIQIKVVTNDNVLMPIEVFASDKFKTIPGNKGRLTLPNAEELGVTFCDQPICVDMIIGSDNFYKFVTGQQKQVDKNLRLIETSIGWTPHGMAAEQRKGRDVNVFYTSCVTVDNALDLRRFWDNEVAGLVVEEDGTSEDLLRNKFKSDIDYVDGRYSVRLPWKNNQSLVSDYKKMAFSRLQHTIRRLIKLNKISEYNEIILDYARQNIIEKCDPLPNNPCRYIPHHPVLKETAVSTKLRIVFDASAKDCGDNSINDCLQEGPNLFPEIIGVLLRFRLFKYAFVTDIEKAFLQIGVNEKDRDFMRFLWMDGDISSNEWPSGKVIAYRFCRVPFGFRSSPYLLNETIKHHLEQFQDTYPRTVEILQSNVYVDDVIVSVESAHVIEAVMRESSIIFSKMAMKLHKWNSNHESDSMGEDQTSSILGLLWNSSLDELCIKSWSTQVMSTKRDIASVLCSFFDPLGWFVPLTNRLKILLHQCWQQKLEWDRELPIEIKKKANAVSEDIVEASKHVIKRWFGLSQKDTRVSIRGFGDASSILYGTCVYLTFGGENEEVSHILCAKSRVAPKQQYSIPRLELLAALLTSRIVKKVVSLLPSGLVSDVICYTDSQVVLCWIRAENKSFKQFVQRRVSEIRRNVPLSKWDYIPSKSNPADILSRTSLNNAWIQNSLWWHGPKPCVNKIDVLDTEKELFQSEVCTRSNNLVVDEPLLHFERFSQYSRLIRTFWYVRRLCKLSNSDFDFKNEELALTRLCQQESFYEEILAIENNKPLPKTSLIRNLNPFLDSNKVIRVSGRLQESNLAYETKHPAILPRNHRFSFLLVKFAHETRLHAGASTLCCELRQRFWIVGCKRLCKKVINSCVKCQRYRGTSCVEEPGPLPSDRVNCLSMQPFKFCAIDYVGPIITLKTGHKLYILLFTCLQVRAIHLECTLSLNTEDFFKAVSRFVSRRGVPSLIRSDNAKTFKCGAEKLSSIFKMNWKFSVEKAPWQGGVWERLVRNVKTALRYSISSCNGTYQDIETLAIYTERIVNSRPLIYGSANDDDFHPITPNHFLIPTALTQTNENLDINRCILSTALSCNRRAVNTFWTKWKREYLVTLNKASPELKRKAVDIGSICFLNECSKRQYWPLVRVKELVKGRDGRYRSAKILYRGKVFYRHIKLLYPLELNN